MCTTSRILLHNEGVVPHPRTSFFDGILPLSPILKRPTLYPILPILISISQELRDSNAASEANAKRFEAAAIEAEQQASALRKERDAVTEEVGTMRSIVEAADGRLVVLSEEIEKLRQARNKLEGRRVELQMALAAEKLKRAFGVAGADGATGVKADICEGVFKRWRLACLEGRQSRMKREAEENRGRAESFEVCCCFVLFFHVHFIFIFVYQSYVPTACPYHYARFVLLPSERP